MGEPNAAIDARAWEDWAQRLVRLEQRVAAGGDPDALSMVVFSGELDRLLAAFVIATGAGACNMRVSMFFTFWGAAALKKAGPQAAGKALVERLFGWLLPGGLRRRRLSRLELGGLGRRMMVREMKRKRVPDLPTLMEVAQAMGVEQYVCEMSMNLMGIRPEELVPYSGRKFCGVARFLNVASAAGTTLFI